MLVKFELLKMHSMQMTLINPNGTFIPVDLDVKIDGIDESLFVGYSGLVFANDIGNLSEIKGEACSREGHCCSFTAKVSSDLELMDLGKVVCVPK
jgi:outer membrane usher protein FimD/PapC